MEFFRNTPVLVQMLCQSYENALADSPDQGAMGIPMDEISAANHPNIRFYKVNRMSSPFPAGDAASVPWQSCTPRNAETMQSR